MISAFPEALEIDYTSTVYIFTSCALLQRDKVARVPVLFNSMSRDNTGRPTVGIK